MMTKQRVLELTVHNDDDIQVRVFRKGKNEVDVAAGAKVLLKTSERVFEGASEVIFTEDGNVEIHLIE